MKQILYLVGFFTFLVSGTAGATNYYVKNGGNDNLNGTSHANAWKTIAKVNTELVASTFNYGDEILFEKGDTWTFGTSAYINVNRNNITVGGTGSTGNRLRFGSYGAGADPILQFASGSQNKAFHVNFEFVEIDGIHLKRCGIYGWWMVNSLIENCTIEGAFRGIWLHEYCSENEIRYNTLDAKEDTYNYQSHEGVQIAHETDTRPAGAIACTYNLVHNNTVTGWSHAQVMIYAGDHNEVYNNYLADDADANGAGGPFGITGRYNKIYNNWMQSSEYSRINGQYNEVYNNVFNMIYNPDNNENVHCILTLAPNPTHPWDCSYNKIYNNVFHNAYEDYQGSPTTSAAFFNFKRANYEHNISNNEFSNNIILNWRLNAGNEADYALAVIDEGGIGSISNNIYKNNCFYKTGGVKGNIIYHGGARTVASWNSADPGGNTVDGNIAVYPGLEDPVNGKFWPLSESSNVVNVGAAGYALLGLVSSSAWTSSISIIESSRVKNGNLPDIGPYEWTDSTPFKKYGKLRIIKVEP